MTPMNGYQITFVTRPDLRHHDKPMAQWLNDLALEMEVCGVTMDFGGDSVSHHHRPHSGHFPRLADQTMAVLVTASAEKVERLFERLKAENVHLFYVKTPIEFDMLGEDT